MAQLIDKGRVVVGVEKYQSKTNGQPDVDQFGNPKMKTKWMTVGECAKWQGDDGSVYESEKVYLKPVNVNGDYYEQKRFWDSESNNNNLQQPMQQQQPQNNSWGQPQQPNMNQR